VGLGDHVPQVLLLHKNQLKRDFLMGIRKREPEYLEELGIGAVDVFLCFFLHSVELDAHQALAHAVLLGLVQALRFAHLQDQPPLPPLTPTLLCQISLVLLYFALQLLLEPLEVVQVHASQFLSFFFYFCVDVF